LHSGEDPLMKLDRNEKFMPFVSMKVT